MNDARAIELACEALQLASAAGAQTAEASVAIARRFTPKRETMRFPSSKPRPARLSSCASSGVDARQR